MAHICGPHAGAVDTPGLKSVGFAGELRGTATSRSVELGRTLLRVLSICVMTRRSTRSRLKSAGRRTWEKS